MLVKNHMPDEPSAVRNAPWPIQRRHERHSNMLTLTNALSPQATERTYEWASEAGVHHWFNAADTYEWAAKTDVHHWFNAADKTTPTAEAGVHHWFNTADTYEWAAKTDVHHWFTAADKTTPAAEAGVHHWFNTADGTAPAQLELSVS